MTIRTEHFLRRYSHGILCNLAFLAGALLLGTLLWQAIAMGVSIIRGVDFPTPIATLRHLVRLLAGEQLIDQSIFHHISDSLKRWITGFSLAATSGILYGLLAGREGIFRRITLPLVHCLQLVPGLAWIPIALLLFGISERTTIFMIAATAFPPVAINVIAGVKQVDVTYLRAARMMGARGATLVFRVLLPGSLPHILSGLRVGLGNGWRVLLAAEMVVGTGTGLGYSIIQSRWTLDYTSAFACLIVIMVIGVGFERLVFSSLEKWTVERWRLRDMGGAA